MARPKSAKQYQYEHLLRANQYSGRLTRIYDSYVAEFTKLAETLDIDPTKLFSFADYPEALERCNKTLEKVVRDVEIFFDRATREEWAESNLKNDELVDYLFEKTGIPKERLKTFYNRNAEALRGFQTRVENGFTISDRIWKITDQYKGEIELGIDLALGEGKSAAQLSRDVRQYLKEPNNLFRRVRDKHGNLVLSQRAKAFHPGQGVYRSSYKNAMRLARTEVNMAYREADAARWDELPFVVGYEIHLSGRHPAPDICDDLKGKYPKDFKFRGWHPHCFCYCTTILSTDEEFDEMQRRILNGEDVSNMHSENEVTDVPEGMKDWISDNADRAKGWSSVPNFIKDNFVEGDLSKGLELDLTPPEPEKPKGKTKFKTEEEKEEIRRQWAERRAVYHYGENILRYMDGISDIDTSTLADLLKKGDVKAVLNEARALAAKGKEILKLSYLENPMQVARDFSAAEAKAVNESVAKKLSAWESAGFTSLESKKKKLLFEINDYFGGNMGGVQQKYKTWKVAQDAYKKQLGIVEHEIQVEATKTKIGEIAKYAKDSSGKKIKGFAKELSDMISGKNVDLAAVNAKIQEADAEIARLEKDRLKKEAERAAKEAAKRANVGKGLWADGKVPFTPEELAERQRLENDLLDKIKAARGGWTAEVEKANEAYADYVHKLSDKYYGKQVSKYDAKEIARLQKEIDKYLAETPMNPSTVNDPAGIWGQSVGGVYRSRDYLRDAYAKELVGLTPDELSIVTRFTSGMRFSNAYNLRGTSAYWRRWWKDKTSGLAPDVLKKMEQVIEEYSEAVSGVLDKMKRYDGVVFRGLDGGGAREVLKSCIEAWDNGTKVWTTYGPASTSTSLHVAHSFDGDVIMIIRNKTGAWIQPVSEYSHELEVMIRRFDKYKILAKPYEMGGRWFIELEEIV